MLKTCSECGIEFECYDKKPDGRKKGRSNKYKRGVNCVTCSPKCAKIHQIRTAREYARAYRQKHLKG